MDPKASKYFDGECFKHFETDSNCKIVLDIKKVSPNYLVPESCSAIQAIWPGSASRNPLGLCWRGKADTIWCLPVVGIEKARQELERGWHHPEENVHQHRPALPFLGITNVGFSDFTTCLLLISLSSTRQATNLLGPSFTFTEHKLMDSCQLRRWNCSDF